MLKQKKEIIYLFVIVSFIIFLNLSYSCIEVKKSSNTSTVIVDSAVEIKIQIYNNCDKEKKVRVLEFVDGEVLYPIENYVSNIVPQNVIVAIPPHISWKNVTINPNESKTLSYILKLKTVDLITIQPTQVIDEDGNIYYSNKIEIRVICNSNKICEENYGENYINCPSDCLQSTEQNKSKEIERVCLNIKDSICEENCPEDPDCKTSTSPIPFWIVPVSILVFSILLFIYFFKKSKISKVYPPKS